MKRIAKITALILLSLILLLNVGTAVCQGIGGKNLLPLSLLEIGSGSMEPLLSEGDLIVSWETPYEKLNAGDIITFHQGTELVTHELRRWDGSRLVTKGTANLTEDRSIGPDEYCARMLFSIPRGGVVLDALTAPLSLALSILLILALFYAGPLLSRLTALVEDTETVQKRPGAVRIMASLAAISLLAATPLYTAAKYSAKINEYTTAIAASRYLSSNVLKENGADYFIQGWEGRNYLVDLTIRNSANELLFNPTGIDVKYRLRAVKVAGGEFKDDYDIEIIPPASVQTITTGNEFTLPTEWDAGTDYPGNSSAYVLAGDTAAEKSQSFGVRITVHQDPSSTNGYALNANDKICFKVYAGTSVSDDYRQELWGQFTLQVAAASTFLSYQQGTQTVGNSLVTYTLKTEQVGEISSRDIKVIWDNEKLYINEYEATVLNLKAILPANLCLDDGDGHGYMILPLEAYSSVTLQFFKTDASLDIKFGETVTENGSDREGDLYAIELGDGPNSA